MQLTFTDKPIEQAPVGFVRLRITEAKTTSLVRVGPRNDVTRRAFITVCRTIIRKAKEQRVTRLAVQLDKSPFPQLAGTPLPELGQLMAENFEMADYEFALKSPSPDAPQPIGEVLICGRTPAQMQRGFQKGQVIGEQVNACRTLANTPGGDMTPKLLASEAKRLAKGLPISVKVLGRADMQKLGMGAVVGVAKGSSEEPQFIVMEYRGSAKKPTVLVGKGVTFDSGGLNIKTGDHMYEMHMDMSGGAAAICAIIAAAKLGLKKHVVTLVPAVENMSASEAMRPGDILKTLSGKTIEVTNTDAEGRLILADALTYAKRFDPAVVFDVATLTGSSLAALGTRASAMFANDDKVAERVAEAGEESGDYVWRLPLWEEYEENIKGDFADFVNAPAGDKRYGDVVNAATFLHQFAKDLEAPWVHLDIVPRMTATESDKLAKGATGTPVRLFVKYIERWAN